MSDNTHDPSQGVNKLSSLHDATDSDLQHKLVFAMPTFENLKTVSDDLKTFELGTDAYYQRREALIDVLITEAEARARAQLLGRRFKFNTSYVKALLELFLVGFHLGDSKHVSQGV